MTAIQAFIKSRPIMSGFALGFAAHFLLAWLL